MIHITKEFKQDLKMADTIIVRFKGRNVALELIKRAKNGWEDSRKIIKYENKYNPNDLLEGFFAIDYIKENTAHILNLILKPGMFLQLSGYENGSNYLKENSLFNDELIATIYDKNMNCICRRVVLDSVVCEDNSARALKFE